MGCPHKVFQFHPWHRSLIPQYYQEGPEQFKPVGETEFVVEIAKQAQEDLSQAQIAGIIGHANMMLGSSVKEVLELHLEKGEGLFRGIRHAGGWDKDERVKNAHAECGNGRSYTTVRVKEAK